MRHPAGQLAHGLQLLALHQGRLGLVAFAERLLHPLGQQLVQALQIRLGALGVGDVEGNADEACQLAHRIEARLGEGADPAVVAGPDLVATLEREGAEAGLTGDGLRRDALDVLGVQDGAPVQVDRLFVGNLQEFHIGAVDEFSPAVRAGHPHRHRRAVGQGAKARLTLAQSVFDHAPLGDVEIIAQ